MSSLPAPPIGARSLFSKFHNLLPPPARPAGLGCFPCRLPFLWELSPAVERGRVQQRQRWEARKAHNTFTGE